MLAGVYESGNSATVRDVSNGSLLLRDGGSIPFSAWYSDDVKDWHVTLLTSVNSNFGFLWGFGIGEDGEKYRIDPSLTLGFIYSQNLGDSSTLSFKMSTVVGGRLKETPCTADYGAIGGVQTVNCRLAASPLRPADTLNELFNEAPKEQFELSVVYKYKF